MSSYQKLRDDFRRKLEVGDRVCFSCNWLRDTGNQTGDLPQYRGIVRRIKPFHGPCGTVKIVDVDWDDNHDATLQRVFIDNLAYVGSIRACEYFPVVPQHWIARND